MKERLLIALVIVLLSSCREKPSAHSETRNTDDSYSDRTIVGEGLGKRIDSLLSKETAIGFSGSVVVTVSDSVVLQNGYGWTDSLKKNLIKPSTKFYLASTTKGIAGTVALIAQQKGILKTSDSLSMFDENCPTDFRNISIHDMLIHTSGLSSEYDTYGATNRIDNIRLLYKRPLGPKGEFNYSSAGYWLAASIIESSTGITYEEFTRENLFERAKMESTDFWFEADEDNESLFAQKQKKFPPGNLDPNWGYRASGGVTTNIIDLKQYYQTLKGYEILNKESLGNLFGPHKTLGSGTGIGYGWYTTTTSRGTKEVWSRGGESFGHNSAIRWFVEEDVAILILTSCGVIEGNREANRTVSDKIENLIFMVSQGRR
ncbi:serine hydrolase domain-containing protein [Flagellimonas allohymeniacidonis]|uniref:Class A beta-lactamase-related serine hydrolase n=1 Tax=Flagellimonas allohymeniacidonis TaxID=2517819 RepID=A0A4Q8QDK3_9FLAO|nr:serine hydrolase domain-containing protein [Allomuricauda hymeniacidonis]TAI48471.1 class A beta-lactamase-related serine hydrolase [Allomuricauda hymeniacidonis]